jgi:hypothetical protein
MPFKVAKVLNIDGISVRDLYEKYYIKAISPAKHRDETN